MFCCKKHAKATHILSAKDNVFALFQDINFNVMLANKFLVWDNWTLMCIFLQFILIIMLHTVFSLEAINMNYQAIFSVQKKRKKCHKWSLFYIIYVLACIHIYGPHLKPFYIQNSAIMKPTTKEAPDHLTLW